MCWGACLKKSRAQAFSPPRPRVWQPRPGGGCAHDDGDHETGRSGATKPQKTNSLLPQPRAQTESSISEQVRRRCYSGNARSKQGLGTHRNTRIHRIWGSGKAIGSFTPTRPSNQQLHCCRCISRRVSPTGRWRWVGRQVPLLPGCVPASAGR